MRQYALSKNQNTILRAVVNAEKERGYALIEHFYVAVFSIPWGRCSKYGSRSTPVTDSQRASISRSIRRLENQILIERKNNDTWNLTTKGRRELKRQGLECPKPRKDVGNELAELESRIAKAV